MTVSGKYVIIAILTVALAAAGTSWWFRYNATKNVAAFWGSEDAALIRDAPAVSLQVLRPATNAERSSPPAHYVEFGGEQKYVADAPADVTHARGLLHLRNALLEDHSFAWEEDAQSQRSDIVWKWMLQFATPKQTTLVTIAADGQHLMSQGGRIVSCQPIATGLLEMLPELAEQAAGLFPTAPAPSPSR